MNCLFAYSSELNAEYWRNTILESIFLTLTLFSISAIVSLVIVLWKLAKPTGGGEPTGLSLFYFMGKLTYEYFKLISLHEGIDSTVNKSAFVNIYSPKKRSYIIYIRALTKYYFRTAYRLYDNMLWLLFAPNKEMGCPVHLYFAFASFSPNSMFPTYSGENTR
jgi:hypothetical protein